MKYILESEELDAIKEKSRKEGFAQAEDLMLAVLNGQRELVVGGSQGGAHTTIYDDQYKENVWRKLIDGIDKGKKKPKSGKTNEGK